MNCSIETAKICYESALEADAPEHCIQWVQHSSREQTHQLMAHPNLALILATGGGGLVRSAYSSGTPALGVGAGNVPVYIEKSADIRYTVKSIIASKTFDYGTVCASEQAVIVEKCISQKVIESFIENNCYFLSNDEIQKLEKVAFDKSKNIMSINVIGKPATYIAKLAEIDVPSETQLLIAKQTKVGNDYPLSSEILAPILAFYIADSHSEAMNLCIDLNYHGGIGHSASIFSNDEDAIKQFSQVMNAGRILVNMPSSQGAVGGIYNTLNPSLTLGCGTGGKNITTDNITAHHLINVQRITRKRMNFNYINFDKQKYLDENYDIQNLEKEYYLNN
jgi:acetaldehyde dehydrogenase/alcohol dehydrogenase